MPQPRRASTRSKARATNSKPTQQDLAVHPTAFPSRALPPMLDLLTSPLAAWTERGEAKPLVEWLDSALGPKGAPRDWPIALWPIALEALTDTVKQSRRVLPSSLKTRIGRLATTLLRFSRPDGTPAFTAPGEPGALTVLKFWAEQLDDPGLGRVVNEWSGARLRHRPAPPLPAFASDERCLAVLRADWSRQGDFVAVDHRGGQENCALELFGHGRRWLGPTWASPAASAPPRVERWLTGPNADLAEWTFATGAGQRTTRTAHFLRGRQLALFADEIASTEPEHALQIDLAPGLRAEAVPQSRALKLSAGRGQSARVLPLGLPSLPYSTERGRLDVNEGRLVLRQRSSGARTWLPLLVSWRPERNRQAATWRQLTVSERSRICPAEEAVAVRVAWGSESLVIYRSLAKPDLRAFLGYQTEAHFVVGLFTKKGDLEPLLVVEDE